MVKIVSQLFQFLKSTSVSPHQRALSVTLGFYLSLFPVAGFTTLLGLGAILIFKLNPYLVQAINILLMPIQVVLMYPFLKTGRMIFFREKELMPEILQGKFSAILNANNLCNLFESVIGGIAIWGIISLITGFFLYQFILKLKVNG